MEDNYLSGCAEKLLWDVTLLQHRFQKRKACTARDLLQPLLFPSMNYVIASLEVYRYLMSSGGLIYVFSTICVANYSIRPCFNNSGSKLT